ncbi:Zinc finger protein 184 [Eumeta japonica]|uniref:Zinc finger protein 184 n=1 Tax=Eumeta variegata TaxID=151549 RepID=A0A4C1SX33_EUMVA|nr:Zinc finger protein 184 [Eumeta japonica]
MGVVSRIRMRPGCLPTKFACQPTRASTSTSTNVCRPVAAKRQRLALINECEDEIKAAAFQQSENLNIDVPSEVEGVGCKLTRPPSIVSGSKLSKDEVKETKKIASLRIHIERVIRRIREFSIEAPCLHKPLPIRETRPQAKQHQNEHVGKVYSCKHCEYITSKRSSHLSHVKLKHATGFLCNLCGFTFVSELGLSQHTTMMHGIKVTNNKVQQSSSNKQDLKTTEEVPHSKPGRYCDVCNVSCNSLQKWKRHVASSKHMYKLNGGTCGECEETFTSREDLRLHYRRVHLKEAQHDESTARQGNPFLPKTWPAKCLHCSEELSDARQYYWHFRKAHPNEEYPVQKDYICDICGKLFGFNSTLVQHRRKHVNDGLYNCMQCSKAFVDKIQLINHEKIHGDDRPFSCEVCCKTFKFETALKKHAKILSPRRVGIFLKSESFVTRPTVEVMKRDCLLKLIALVIDYNLAWAVHTGTYICLVSSAILKPGRIPSGVVEMHSSITGDRNEIDLPARQTRHPHRPF